MALAAHVSGLQNQILRELPLNVQRVLKDIWSTAVINVRKHIRSVQRRGSYAEVPKRDVQRKVGKVGIRGLLQPARYVPSQVKDCIACVLHIKHAKSAA